MELSDQKLITCILPKGVAFGVVEKLKEEHGISTANIHNGRGIGKITPLAYRGLGAQSEKEILSVQIPENNADELFEFIYNVAEINRPHGGLIFMNSLSQATLFTIPEIPEEE